MLSFQEFFTVCAGTWITERTYHYPLEADVERSHTEFRVNPLTADEKQKILPISESSSSLQIDVAKFSSDEAGCPGFSIAFDTRSERGEQVSMSLQALFVPDSYVTNASAIESPPLPLVAQVAADATEVIRGFYLRNEGYSEGGAIAGRFTYQPTRQTLEMTTYYKRSVAVDQMRMISPDTRLRTIVTYQRPEVGQPPTIINLVGFGVEQKQLG
ncbi:phycobiliprotein lyase [Leptolyngbya sp. FACHB-36]|uniref:phycobiliprotein lyase n=1 Tax=Leptolyngbya sp. FACHB-36 TaxID=2692808 RepID=UPI001680AA62|nr:phycobiliprotein lyase [Leptolyngbya sp. FACHB-36]MBD2020972.1 phycobiliprotein lyase [Leptolyngbya sp. FACHB-36]